MSLTRRGFCGAIAASAICTPRALSSETFRLRYALASCMYGTLDLSVILPEAPRIGADAIDVWPLKHGNQREQIEAMGHNRFAELLQAHGVKLGVVTRYDLGPARAHEDIPLLKKYGGSLLVTGSGGPAGLAGDDLKAAMRRFAQEIKPLVAAAEQAGVTVGIENHGGSLIDSADSIRCMVDAISSPRLGVALAPYHLPQDPAMIARLIDDLGHRLVHFYAWQHGRGCMTKLPKDEELLQLPSRGPLDFTPILAALRRIGFGGYTEVFMHPVPRGVPILETAGLVTEEINRSRAYLESCLEKVGP